MKKTNRNVLWVVAIVVLVVLHIMSFKQILGHRVVDAKQNSVAYADGTAEFIIEDSVPDQISHIYRATVSAIGVAPWWYAPTLTTQGGAWQRQVYTFDQEESDSCQNDILFLDRVNKTATTHHIAPCILGTLDEHDITHFIARSYSTNLTQVISVGTYEDGAIAASHEGPANLGLEKWAFNWELNKAVLFFGSTIDCGMDENCTSSAPEMYEWDLTSGSWTAVAIPTYSNAIDLEKTTLSYDHDSNTFTFSPVLTNSLTPRDIIVK